MIQWSYMIPCLLSASTAREKVWFTLIEHCFPLQQNVTIWLSSMMSSVCFDEFTCALCLALLATQLLLLDTVKLSLGICPVAISCPSAKTAMKSFQPTFFHLGTQSKKWEQAPWVQYLSSAPFNPRLFPYSLSQKVRASSNVVTLLLSSFSQCLAAKQ